jgi:hypothetical protein
MASTPSTDQKQPPDEVIALDKLLTSNDSGKILTKGIKERKNCLVRMSRYSKQRSGVLHLPRLGRPPRFMKTAVAYCSSSAIILPDAEE